MSIFRSLVSGAWRCGLVVVAVLAATADANGQQKAKGGPMSYGEAREFLAKHTKLVELTNEQGARVAICPELQGRVMTSSCDGLDGLSFGFINKEFIEAGTPDERFSNYGGEDRMWLSPEGGQFSLWFDPGAEQTLDNWFTPPALNEGAFEVISGDSDPFYRMSRPMRLLNTSSTRFRLKATREVRLLTEKDLETAFGKKAAAAMAGDDVQMVAYETVNTINNQGAPMTKQKGLVSIWILSMLTAGPQTVVIVPYKPGDESKLGPVVKSDYFGEVPPERLKIIPEAILFSGDSNYRSKIGTSQRRARNVMGSIDFQNSVLTLVHFTMPKDPTKQDYMNNMWEVPQAEPYKGDVANSYNDGPPAPGAKGLGAFYEVESLSPAKALASGESLTHRHRTVHIQADLKVLADLAKDVLGVDLETVRKEMIAE